MRRLSSLWNQFLARTDFERCARTRGARPGLDKVIRLLDRLGRPQDACPVVLVAGSKGKGSVAGLLQKGLTAAGWKCGQYSSPHLSDWRERIQIDGRWATVPDLTVAFEAVLGAAEGEETFFDLLTAAAYYLFAHIDCAVEVIEVGLGGRLDSTNVTVPRAALVTSIELEHTEVLGHDLATIAGEKAGIFHPNSVPWGGAVLPAEAVSVLEARAIACGTALRRPTAAPPRSLPWPQAHMAANYDLAYSVLRDLEGDFPGAAEALQRLPLEALVLPGRYEHRWTEDGREVTLDTAHTVESLAAVLKAWRADHFQHPRQVLFALREEKDPGQLAASLVDRCGPIPAEEDWFVCPAGDHPRSADPRSLAKPFSARVLAEVALPPGIGPVLVTGSTYLVGALRPQTAAPELANPS